MIVRNLSADEALRNLPALASILVDCVLGGASVSFMWPFSQGDAEMYFLKVIAEVQRGEKRIFGAFDESNLTGTVQLVTAMPPNQPHRAEIAKLLVHRAARGKGTGAALMDAAEKDARSLGKTLLVLDTATGGDAERLYLRLNWTKAAVIPKFAKYPDGRWGDTTIFWKSLV